MLSLRSVSWFFAALALLVPLAWAYAEIAAFNASTPVPRCGMPMLAFVGLAAIGMSVLSTAALAFAIPAYRRQPRPRSWLRRMELIAVAQPLGLGLAFLLSLFF
jgi:hypothetical protein